MPASTTANNMVRFTISSNGRTTDAHKTVNLVNQTCTALFEIAKRHINNPWFEDALYNDAVAEGCDPYIYLYGERIYCGYKDIPSGATTYVDMSLQGPDRILRTSQSLHEFIEAHGHATVVKCIPIITTFKLGSCMFPYIYSACRQS